MRPATILIAMAFLIAAPTAQSQGLRRPDPPPSGLGEYAVSGEGGASSQLPVYYRADETAMETPRDALLALRMECLALDARSAAGDGDIPGRSDSERGRLAQLVLKMSGAILGEVGERADFLEAVLENSRCFDPAKGEDVPLKDYFAGYVRAQGYIGQGYFKGSELDQDPARLFLKLMLFDKWAIYETKMLRTPAGDWRSLEDCVKGRFQSPYSHRALDSLKHAFQCAGEAKGLPLRQAPDKVRLYSASVLHCLNTVLYIVEANREFLSRSEVGRKSIEIIRGAALKAKLCVQYRRLIKVRVVDELEGKAPARQTSIEPRRPGPDSENVFNDRQFQVFKEVMTSTDLRDFGKIILAGTHPTGDFVSSPIPSVRLNSDRDVIYIDCTVNWKGGITGTPYITKYRTSLHRRNGLKGLEVVSDTAIIDIDPDFLERVEDILKKELFDKIIGLLDDIK